MVTHEGVAGGDKVFVGTGKISGNRHDLVVVMILCDCFL